MGNQPRGGREANKPGPDRPTKADRKYQARAEREQIHAQMARRRKTRIGALVVGLLGTAVVVVALVALSGGGGTPGSSPSAPALPGLMTSPAPWGANNDQVLERMKLISLPPFLDQTGVGEHHHVRLFLYVHGDPVQVPADVAVVNQVPVSPLHTHATDGLIHVETSDPTYTGEIGQFFDVWGLRLSTDCLGAYCAQGQDSLRAYVDGRPFTGDPRTIPLADQSAVVLVFGSTDEIPQTIPDTYTFGT